MSAQLYITDGTTTVSLINGPVYLQEWLPSIPDYKGGGVYADSPIGESRVLVYKQTESITDTMSIKIANLTQDNTIATLRKLQNLLESAANYFTNPYATTPVYLVAKASRETNARYATIIRGRIPQLGPILAQPFTNCPPVLDNIALSIEHHPWVSAAPGSDGTDAVLNAGTLSAGTIPDHQILAQSQMETFAAVTPNYPSWGGVSATTFEQSSTRSYSGDYSLHIVTAAADQGTRQVWNLNFTEPNETYTVTCWVYVESGTVRLGIADDDGSYSNATEVNSTTTGSWEQITVSGAATTTGCWVYVLSEGGAAEWYMDDAELFISSGMNSTIVDVPDQTEWYVANCRREQRLDSIYVYNNGSWSDNLLYEASTPLDITGINNDEAVYFGIWGHIGSGADPMANGGPFSSLIFNISRAIGGTSPTFVWEYLSSVAVGWATIPGIVDRTESFSQTGVNTVSWRPPEDWEVVALRLNLSVAEGSLAGAPDDEAYWVRCRKTGGTVSNGEQAQVSSPLPYTVTWPYVELGATAIGGDLQAKGKIDVKNYSGETRSSASTSVAVGGDDTYFDSAVGTNQSAATVIYMGTNYYAGCRFQSLAIEQGSEIISATIEFKRANTTGTDITRMQIRGHDVDDSSALLSSYANYAAWAALPQTDAQVYWQMELASSGGAVVTTPNFASVVQEIVDRTGWASGNDMTIMFDDDVSDGTSSYQFASYDNVTYEEPILTVVWQDVSGGVWINRCIAGVRDVARGSDFISHINMSDWQPQKGIVVKANTAAAFADSIWSAGDRMVRISNTRTLPWPPSVPFTPVSEEDFNIIISIDSNTSPSFVGTFRAFARVSSDLTSDQTADFTIAVRTGSSGLIKFGTTSAEFRATYGRRAFANTSANQIVPVDLGLVTIPQTAASGYDKVDILFAGAGSAAGININVHDIILMPADEWIGEISTKRTVESAVLGLESMHFDSITQTRKPIYAYHTDANGSVKAILGSYSQTLNFSPVNTQRIYFLFNTVDRDSPQAEGDERSSPWALTSVKVQTLRKYQTLRGDG